VHPLIGYWASADQAIFRLKEHLYVARDIVRHHRWDPDAEIDQHSRRLRQKQFSQLAPNRDEKSIMDLKQGAALT
jgi:hypothetical protein